MELPKLDKIDPREWEFYKQREVQGFSDDETFSLDTTISEFILPRLKRFRETEFSYPPDLENNEEWRNILDDMIFAFECNSNKFDLDYQYFKQNNSRIDRGLQLFAKYYFDLWF